MVDAGFEGGAFVRRQTRNDMSASRKSLQPEQNEFEISLTATHHRD